MTRVTWKGDGQLSRQIDGYEARARGAVDALLRRWEREIEAYAKQHAPWRDRTANARQSLFAFTTRDGATARLVLSHRVDYGVYLELRWAGRYAVILPTLQAHQGQVFQSIRQLFG